MLSTLRWIVLFALCAGLAASLLGGCSKYDGLERNMQYVSDDLLRRDLEQTWRQVNEAHAAWTKAGSSHDKNDAAYAVYTDAYARYAIVYNEMQERKGSGGFGSQLRTATDTLPPPPPGLPAAPVGTSAAKPKQPETAPASRELNDAAPAASPAPAAAASKPFAPAPAAAAKPAPAAPAAQADAGGNRYVIQNGDSLRTIAKRHNISEKALMEANGLTNPDKIAAGKTLVIPGR